jgi:hypothetical protein
MIEFIGPLYNWLQLFTNQYLTHCRFLSDWTLHGNYSDFQLNCQFKSKSKLCYDRRSVGQSILVSSTHLGLNTRFLFVSDSCGFVDVGRLLWREDGSVFYNVQCTIYYDGFSQSFTRRQPSKHVPTHAPRNNTVEVFFFSVSAHGPLLCNVPAACPPTVTSHNNEQR